jgi:hypothetical protein
MTAMSILQAPISLIPKPLLNLDSQQCPHCEVNLRVSEIPLMSISSRFDEATTLAWECPFCHQADVIPGMQKRVRKANKERIQ